MEKKSIGKFIAILRKANGYTQQQFADLLNVSNKTISSWETDKSSPDLSTIPIIAEMFHVSCDEILRGEKFSTSKEDVIDNSKSEIIKKNIINQALHSFKNRNYISIVLFVVCVMMIIISLLLNQFMPYIIIIILLFLALLDYIVGLVLLILNYSNVKYKLRNDDIDIDICREYRAVEKQMLFLKCLYSFFVLSPFFCYVYNKQLDKNDIYKLSDDERESCKRNKIKKKKFVVIYSIVLFICILGIVINTCLPNYLYSGERYSEKDFIEKISTFNLVKIKSGIELSYNYNIFSYSTNDIYIASSPVLPEEDKPQINTEELQEGIYQLNLPYGEELKEGEVLDVGNGFFLKLVDYSAYLYYKIDLSMVGIAVFNIIIDNGTYFYILDNIRYCGFHIYKNKDVKVFSILEVKAEKQIINNIIWGGALGCALVEVLIYFLKKERLINDFKIV